jgi:hypothetical protein
VTQKAAIFFRIILAGILLIESIPSIAAPEVAPKFNTGPSCESPARKAISYGSSKGSIEACRKSEKEAHEVLIKHWPKYAKIDKTNCVGKVTQGGPPSYIELHSCLETMKYSREIRHANHLNNLKKEFRPKRPGQQ